MLENGAETHRVEDTMIRMAKACGVEHAESYATPTAILFSLKIGDDPETQMARIVKRKTDLKIISDVNRLSRELSEGKRTPREAFFLMKELEKTSRPYPAFVQLTASALASACFSFMFGGAYPDCGAALFSGGIGYLMFLVMEKWSDVRFFSEFFSSMVIGLLSIFFIRIGIGTDLEKIIVGSVMPLVPGLLITNAIRDLMAGHLVSGLTKGAEALLTAFAIGSGVAFILLFFN